MTKTGILIAFSIGLMVGQYTYRSAYNIDTLESRALDFAAESHYIGCKGAGGEDEFCFYISTDYTKTVESLWHNKAWKKDNE